MKNLKIAQYIDHTLLKPDATLDQIINLCSEAKLHHFKGVCVNSYWIENVSKALVGTEILPVAVIGFPLGACSTATKVFEAKYCSDHGAKEIDMVINLGLLKSRQLAEVEKDIRDVCQAVKIPVKVILETVFLSIEEIKVASELSKKAGAAFVKTCTGFAGGGATVEHINIMRSAVGPEMGVKASGGVKSLEMALALIEAGATRIGTSSGVALAQGQNPTTGGY